MTPERLSRIKQTLNTRQPDLSVLTDQVHKPRNLSAIIRSCDAFGLANMHVVWPKEGFRAFRKTAGGSYNWVTTHTHRSMEEAVSALKGQGHKLYAAQLSDRAIDFRDVDYTRPTAVLFGQEKYGVTDEAIAMADQDIVIPMVGMVQSLNVSVAGAVMFYEAQRQRELAGMYQLPQISAQERHRVLFEGGHPIYAKACKRKGIDYPELDDGGQIIANDSWWQAMREKR